jgi:hypothetical protein
LRKSCPTSNSYVTIANEPSQICHGFLRLVAFDCAAHRAIFGSIGDSFGDCCRLSHLQSCYKRLTIFRSGHRLDRLFCINNIILSACMAHGMS